MVGVCRLVTSHSALIAHFCRCRSAVDDLYRLAYAHLLPIRMWPRHSTPALTPNISGNTDWRDKAAPAGYVRPSTLAIWCSAIVSFIAWLVVPALLLSGCGGGGGSVSDQYSSAPQPTSSSQQGLLALLAGSSGGPGNIDGIGAAASFFAPASVALDSAGNVYVADAGNNTIRKITSTGIVTTLAGTAGVGGSTDATGAAARFSQPSGVAVDGTGNVYVADTGNLTIRKITKDGVVTTLAGTAGIGGSTDAAGAAARFSQPSGVAVDGAGNVYVADSGAYNVRKITPSGVVTTVAGSTAGLLGVLSDNVDGTGTAARFSAIHSLAVDGAGNVFVADYNNHTIRKITPAGVVTTLAGTAGIRGSSDGIGAAASFDYPNGITVDGAGNLYVTDLFTLRKITPAGVVTTLAGTAGNSGSDDGIDTAASFNAPTGVAADGSGNLYVADMNCTIRKITPDRTVTTLAGAAAKWGNSDATGDAARFGGYFRNLQFFNIPPSVAADSSGNVYVTDMSNATIRKITPAGVVTTLAGNGDIGKTDSAVGPATFTNPKGIAVDRTGNVYVTDNCSLRKITPDGFVTTPIGRADQLCFGGEISLATDFEGNIYANNAGSETVSKITPEGVITALASTTGIGGKFSHSYGAAVDDAGNVYVTAGNTILKITKQGSVTTLAGTAGQFGSADGIGAAARFNDPSGVAVDGPGNVYVADRGNNTIRKISPAGAVTTVAGEIGSFGFAPGTLPGVLRALGGIAISNSTLFLVTGLAIATISPLP